MRAEQVRAMIGRPPDVLAASLPAAAFALPRQDTRDQSRLAKLSGKVSRFAARHVRMKTLAVRSARPLVTFTFDDAPASACGNGARILEQHGIRATYYIAGGGCGAQSPGGPLASVAQLQALWANGHEMGCHTFSHLAVSNVSNRELGRDLDRNRSALEDIGTALVARNFAYPYGDVSFRTKRYLERRFDSCRSLLRGVNAGIADLGALKTWPLENASLDRAKLVELIAETVRTRGWLIFSSHDVDAEPSRFGVSPDLLAMAVTTAQSAGCRFVTVAEALKILAGTTSNLKPGKTTAG
jgi:peptidoglycan/xylan/chitin deacetylase (PgdA/CDA1 family)